MKICLQLAKRLDEQGIESTARLMAAARTFVDLEDVRDLARLLHSIADTEGWSQTAALFNALGRSWSDLEGESKKVINSNECVR